MIKRLLFLCWLLAISTNAYIYNDSLLLIYAKIVPKIMLLDHTERENGPSSPILCILYEKGDRRTAVKLRELILANLQKSGKNSIRIVTKPYSQTEKCEEVSAFLLLNTGAERVKKAIGFAKKRQLLSFAYDSNMLDYGAIVSLHGGKKVYPLVNIDAIKQNRLRLDPLLFQVAKIYRGGGS